MMSLVIVIGLVAACSAGPSLYYGAGVPAAQYYSGPYYHHPPPAVIGAIKSQYHTQNELGQYAYGYNDGLSSKSETKHASGLTEGSYSYVDPNGVLQQYKYESDENGYRVSGTNLPVAPAAAAAAGEPPQPVQDTPEVAAAKAAHRVAYDEAKKAADASPDDGDDGSSDSGVSVVGTPAAAVVSAPAHHTYGYSAYGAYPSYAYHAAAPVAAYAYAAPQPVPYAYAAAAPVVGSYAYAPYAVGSYSPVHSQYHAQDEFGQYAYGYNSDTSSKAEVKTLDGVTRGGYSYVDANGHVQQYQYVSDPVNGFRVSGTNLPSNNL